MNESKQLSSERNKMFKEIRNGIYPDNDTSYDKQLILNEIYSDKDILILLNNLELDINIPEDFRNINIFTTLLVPETQTDVRNFICFDVNHIEDIRTNNIMLNKEVVFMTIAHQNDMSTDYGIDRQDMLALLIKKHFDWSNLLGLQLKRISDKGYVSENKYNYRIIKYHSINTNGLQNGTPNNIMDKIRGLKWNG